MEYIAIVRTKFVRSWRQSIRVELSVGEYHDKDVDLISLRGWLNTWLQRWIGAELDISLEAMGTQIIEAALEEDYLPISCRVMEGDVGVEVMA